MQIGQAMISIIYRTAAAVARAARRLSTLPKHGVRQKKGLAARARPSAGPGDMGNAQTAGGCWGNASRLA